MATRMQNSARQMGLFILSWHGPVEIQRVNYVAARYASKPRVVVIKNPAIPLLMNGSLANMIMLPPHRSLRLRKGDLPNGSGPQAGSATGLASPTGWQLERWRRLKPHEGGIPGARGFLGARKQYG